MKNYNYDLISIQYTLIDIFLFKADRAILDISYSIDKNKIIIQIVILEGSTIQQKIIDNLKKELVGFEVIVKEIYLSKERFNDNKGEWQPKYYKWLDYLLFSKAETL